MALNKKELKSLIRAQFGEPPDMTQRVREAPDPRSLALERARAALGIAQHGRDEIHKAYDILRSAEADSARLLDGVVRAHEEHLARAEIVWAKSIALYGDLVGPDTKYIEHAEHTLKLVEQEIARREKETPKDGA